LLSSLTLYHIGLTFADRLAFASAALCNKFVLLFDIGGKGVGFSASSKNADPFVGADRGSGSSIAGAGAITPTPCGSTRSAARRAVCGR
jgi:hypothetical protein